MNKAYVIAGPCRIGNVFGYFGQSVPAGKFAVVTRGEYANGGCGPSQCVQRLFDSATEAEQAAQAFDSHLSETS